MKVKEILEFLENVDGDTEVSFCIGEAMGYGINSIYSDGDKIWLDSEDI